MDDHFDFCVISVNVVAEKMVLKGGEIKKSTFTSFSVFQSQGQLLSKYFIQQNNTLGEAQR